MRRNGGTEPIVEFPLQPHVSALRRRIHDSGYDRDGSLQRLLGGINERYPNAGDLHVLRVVQRRFELLQLGVGERGFLPLRPGVLNGPYELATDVISGLPVRAARSHLARTTVVTGATGTGKTTLLHGIVEQALADGVNVWTIDAKDDSQQLAVRNERTLIIDAHAPFNLLQRPSFLSKPEHQAVFTSVFARSFFGGEHLKQIVSRAFEQLDDHGTFEDLATNIERSVAKNGTYAERDATRGGLQRAYRVKQLYPGLYQTRHGLRIEDLCTRPIYVPIKIQTEVDEFIFSYLIHLLFLYQRHRAERAELSHLIQMDEGMLSWSRNTNTKIEGVPLLSYVQSMIREFGIGMLISSTSTHLLDPLLKSNAFLRIALNVTDHLEATEIARTFGLSEPQREYFHRGLTRGECIIKFADDWHEPVLATFAARTQRKTATLVEWEAAKRRTTALIPPPPRPVELTAAAREGVTGQPAPVERPAPSPPPTFATAVAKTPLLNAAQRAFLLFVAERGITLVTEAYESLHLKPMQGNRIQKRLIALNLLTATRIRIGSGRGREATGLTATDTAYNILGIKRPHLGRGGPQHAWLVRSLRDRITAASIETQGADIAIAYNSTTHASLLQALRATRPDLMLKDGDAVAIEIELDPARTADRNLRRNDAFRLTIVGARPADLPTAQRIAARYTNALAVDIYALVEALEH